MTSSKSAEKQKSSEKKRAKTDTKSREYHVRKSGLRAKQLSIYMAKKVVVFASAFEKLCGQIGGGKLDVQ